MKKIDYRNYLYFVKPTFNLVLQCEILKLMHNSEKLFCYSSFM